MGDAVATVKPTFTLEQLRCKRGRYEEVNGVICKWCPDCKKFLPIDQFHYRSSLGRHDAFCCEHQAKRKAYVSSPEGKAESAYWAEVHKRRLERVAAGHTPQARKHSRHEIVNGVVHKTCTACEQLLPFEAFKKHGKHLRSQCRICQSPKEMEYRLTHRAERSRLLNARYASDIQYRLGVNLRGHIQKGLAGTVKKSDTTITLLGCSVTQLREHLQSLFQPGMTWENWGVHRQGGPRRWHIDHIRPVTSFDLTDPEQQKACFHWSNMQPMWGIDNIRKGNRWEDNT